MAEFAVVTVRAYSLDKSVAYAGRSLLSRLLMAESMGH